MKAASISRYRHSFLALLGGLACLAHPGQVSAGNITTFAGGVPGGGGPATTVGLSAPRGVAVDQAGNVYVADTSASVVYRVSAAGGISVFAGNGLAGYGGDGGPAILAQLASPLGIAVDAAGNVYIADVNNQRIRMVNSAGNISTIAGDGTAGFNGDGGAATNAQLSQATHVAVDGAGNIYVSDQGNLRVRRINSTGNISTVAGTGGFGYNGDGMPATQATLTSPSGLAVDASGNLYIADAGNQRVRMVNANGIISTFAGNGTAGFAGDNAAATSASLSSPYGLAVDSAGTLYIADYANQRVRKVDPTGTITTIAGNGQPGFGGDGAVATGAQLSAYGVAVDTSGNVYIADVDNARVREVNTAGYIVTLAGGGIYAVNGDGGPATAAQLLNPSSVVVDSSLNTYIVDTSNSRIRRVDAAGTITTMAGNGTAGFSGDNGPASAAQLNNPTGIAVDTAGNLYVADQANNRVRRVDGTGTITTVAGGGPFAVPATSVGLRASSVAVDGNSGTVYITDLTGQRVYGVDLNTQNLSLFAGNGALGYGGDGGPAAGAQFNSPHGMAVDATGNVYIADLGNCVIRKVSAGVISTVAGNGSCGYSGDGGPATLAQISNPYGLTLDASGNLYIADYGNSIVRKLGLDGNISTFAGVQGGGAPAGDGGPASAATIGCPYGLAVDGNSGAIYISDPCNFNVRVVGTDGNISTYAGNGLNSFGGDGGPATSASFAPLGLTVDYNGYLYIADERNCNIRVVDTSGNIATFAGGGSSEGDGGPATSGFICPDGLAFGRSIYAADVDSNNVRQITVHSDPSNDIISTFAGNGTGVFVVPTFFGDGGNATAAGLLNPTGVSVDAQGNLYVSDTGNQRIRVVSSAHQQISTVAGSGVAGFRGDGTAAADARLSSPAGIAVDPAGNLFFADQANNRVRKIDLTGTITTFAGGFVSGLATAANFSSPTDVALDGTGNLYVSVDSAHVVYRISPSGAAGVFAGNGADYSGVVTAAPATQMALGSVYAVAVDPAGNVYILNEASTNTIFRVDTGGNLLTIPGSFSGSSCGGGPPRLQAVISMASDSAGNLIIDDAGNYCVVKVDTGSWTMSPVAGTGTFVGPSVDGGPATSAALNPRAVAIGPAGDVYIVDSLSTCRIRKVDAAGTITTVAGMGQCGSNGDGGPATSALISPVAVTTDSNGNLYVVEPGRIRKVDATGTIATIAGVGTTGFSGDGGSALNAQLYANAAVVDAAGNVYVAEYNNLRIRKIDPAGNISSFAAPGITNFGSIGDGGPATGTGLGAPSAVALDATGNVYIADTGNESIRRVDSTGMITTVAGNGTPGFSGDGGPASAAQLNNPTGIAADGTGNLYIADQANNRIREFIAAAAQSIKVTSVPTIIAVGGSGSLTATGGGSGNPVTMNAITPSTCSLSGNTLSGLAEGWCTVLLDQAGNDSYLAAAEIRQSIIVSSEPPQVITVTSAPTTLTVNGSAIVAATGGASRYPVTIMSATPATCSVSGNLVTGLSVGSCMLLLDQTGTPKYPPARELQWTISVTPGPQAIRFSLSFALNVGDSAPLSATGGASGNPVTFSSATSTVCSVSGNVATGLAPGLCTVLADQAGSANYLPAPEVSASGGFSGSQAITIASPPTTLPVGGSVTIAATGGFSQFPILFADFTLSTCTITSSVASPITLTGLAQGTCTISAYQAFNNARAPLTITVTPAQAQSITVTSAPTTMAVGTSSMLAATGGASGNPVTFSSATPTICSVTGTATTARAVGTCIVLADQAGNASYLAAPELRLSITVTPGAQAITVTSAPSTLIVGATDPLAATGGASGNPVIFSSATPTICGVVGNAVTGVATGSCTVKADQAANANYLAAPELLLPISVTPAPQTIVMTSVPVAVAVGGSATLAATGGASGNPVLFTSSTPATCSVAGSVLTGGAAGSCTVVANQAGTANYLAAAPVTSTLAVVQPTDSVAPTAVAFNSVAIGQSSASQTVTVSNTATLVPLTLAATPFAISGTGTNASEYSVVGGGSTPCNGNLVLPPLAACTVVVTFSPTSANGAGSKPATLSVFSNATTKTVSLSGTAATPTDSAAPSPLAFASVQTGQSSAPLTVTVSNTGTVPLTLGSTAFSLAGANAAEYSAVGGGSVPCGNGLVLPVSGTCYINVTFSPTVAAGAGSRPAALDVFSNATTKTVSLTGTAVVPTDSAGPSPLAFGSVQNGQTGTLLNVTVTNTGTVPLTMAATAFAVTGANPTEYSAGGSGTAPCSGGLVVPVSGTCTIGVTFSPTASAGAGSKPATLSIYSNATTKTVSLTGTATVPTDSAGPSPLAFASVQIGRASGPLTMTVTNTGSGPLTLAATAFSLTGANPTAYTATGSGATPCASGLVLPVSGTCTAAVSFSPTTANGTGSKPATLSIFSDATTKTVSLTGTAIAPAPSLGAGTFNFGGGTTTRTNSFTLTNSGATAAAFVVGSISASRTGSGAGTYTLVGGTCVVGNTVAVGGTCTVNVQFAPNGTAVTTGTVTVSGTGVGGGTPTYTANRNMTGS